MRKRVGGFKDNLAYLFKSKTSKKAVHGRCIKQKTIRRKTFWNNNYTEYESNGDRNKELTIEEYLE